jgi:hypothetical protein
MRTVDDNSKLSGFATLTGTPEEIRSRLNRLGVERVIALTFEHGSERAVRAFADTVESIAPLVSAILKQRQHKTLESIVEALVPNMPPPPHMLVEARMTAQARKAVLEGGDWLTAAQVAKLAGFSTTNLSAQPNKWKKDGLIFAVRHHGVDYFPGYGLDPATNYRPYKALARVLRIFGNEKDAWGLAYWFTSINSFLGGKRPQDLLAEQGERVVCAAEDEMEAVAHG